MDLRPYRGPEGAPYPPAWAALPLPPGRMPLLRGGRPRKEWRYVGVYGPELMLCAADVRVGPLRQQFWALGDRGETRFARRPVDLRDGRLRIADGDVVVDLALEGGAGVDTLSPHGSQYAWTRKTAGVRARGTVCGRPVDGWAVIDLSAGYHARDTSWSWSAGCGRTSDGRAVAWNLVAGLHDAAESSERTIWLDGRPQPEVGPVFFVGLERIELPGGAELRFSPTAVRARHDRLGILESEYEAPFGSFAGTLPGGVELAQGFGVMERHRARW